MIKVSSRSNTIIFIFQIYLHKDEIEASYCINVVFLHWLSVCGKLIGLFFLSYFFFTLFDILNLDNFIYLSSYPLIIYANFYEDKDRLLKENRGKSGVYRIVNLSNDKSYVGSSRDLQRRFHGYFNLRRLTDGVEKNRTIAKALIKYGYINFRLEILEYCKEEERISREQYYMDLLNPEYNILKKAGSVLGLKLSYERVLKMSGHNHYNYGKERCSYGG